MGLVFLDEASSAMGERLYTTVDVAKVCSVSLRTIIRWVDEGRLPSFRTPGGHRRVREEDLRGFLERYNIPCSPTVLAHPQRILIVGEQGDAGSQELKELENSLRQILRRASDAYEVHVVEGLYEASIQIGLVQPDLVIAVSEKHGAEMRKFCRALRSFRKTRNTRILLLNHSLPQARRREGNSLDVHAVIHRPFTVEKLRGHLLQLLAQSSLAQSV
jgi:excisionase family DNA binding protein